MSHATALFQAGNDLVECTLDAPSGRNSGWHQ